MHCISNQTITNRTTSRPYTNTMILCPVYVIGHNQEIIDKAISLDDIQLFFASVNVLLCVLTTLLQSFFALTNNLFPTILIAVYFWQLQFQLSKYILFDFRLKFLNVALHFHCHPFCFLHSVISFVHLNKTLFHFHQSGHITFAVSSFCPLHVVTVHSVHLQIRVQLILPTSVRIGSKDALNIKFFGQFNHTDIDCLLSSFFRYFVWLYLNVQIVTKQTLQLF